MNKDITLLELLIEVKKMGYIVLTFEEAEKMLGVNPNNITQNYFTLFYSINKYFIFNERERNIIYFLQVFLKREKVTYMKKTLFKILEKNKGVL